MNVLICPNAFKGSLTAIEAAVAIESGLNKSQLQCNCILLPLADGGDGSLEVLAKYLNADLHTLIVNGPLQDPISAKYGWNATESMGIVEMAEASGLKLMSGRDLNPWKATSYGTGELIIELIKKGAKTIFLTIGGSATVDAGIGIMSAVGLEFYSKNEKISHPTPKDLKGIQRIVVPKMSGIRINILCDVDNPLLGDRGAAPVFGPQKGVTQSEISILEQGFENLVHIVKEQFGKDIGDVKHGGAAGGVAAGLYGLMDAELVSGGEKILNLAGYEHQLKKADLVITGEGKIDQQTKYGKAPGLVASKARELGVPVIGLSGMLEDEVVENFDAVFPIIHKPETLEEALNNAGKNLESTSTRLGNLLAAQIK